MLAALADVDDVYFDAVSQIMMPRWAHGRTALVGDAAYGPSPVSGMGASLALVGAYVLAGELARHAHPQEAFAVYETRLRPYVTRAQKLPPGVPWIAHPHSRLGVALLHKVLWLAAGPLLRLRKGLAGASPVDQFDLPDYTLGCEKQSPSGSSSRP